MNDFIVELYIDDGSEGDMKFSDLNKKEKEQWKKNIEQRALSEFYNRKVKTGKNLEG